MSSSDIFISYAHLDNEGLTEDDNGWVTDFHRALEVRVGQLLGRKPQVFRDPRLSGNDVFPQRLVGELDGASVLVCVLSPRYLNSEWCRRELDEFLDRRPPSQWAERSKAPVFKTIKTPVPYTEHPEMVRDLLGYEFFILDPQTGRPKELNRAFGPQIQLQYWQKLDELAWDIKTLLVAAEQAGPTVAERGSVFLAETTFDLTTQRDALRRELRRRGYRVLPDRPLPLREAELREALSTCLAECKLIVHLVGREYAVVPEGATRSLGELQDELASEHAGETPRLIWMPAGLEVIDERQQSFVERLRLELAGGELEDLIEGSLEELKSAMLEVLEPPRRALAGSSARAISAQELTQIYLICDQRDTEAVQELSTALFESGYEVIPSLFEGDEAEIRLYHQESLLQCDGALIYWGEGGELWLRRKLSELLKIAGYGRVRPIPARAVYPAPPSSGAKGRLRTHAALVLPLQESVDLGALEPFFALLAPAEDSAAQ